MNRDTLLSLSRPELKALFLSGHPIDPESLDDSEYLGVSLGLPAWVDRLAWKTFIKTFHRDPSSGLLRGWNIRLVQRGLDGPHTSLERGGRARTFGHFAVQASADDPMRAPMTTGLLLHYGEGGNRGFDPMGAVRDPIVALEPQNPDLLLGWMWLNVLGVRLPTPSYFLLERLRPLGEVVQPIRRVHAALKLPA